jgi:hypothetical protein
MKLRRGSVLIEFTLAAAVLAALLAGAFQAGTAIATYNSLLTAVRAGAGYAAQHGAGSAGAVRNVVVYGDPAPPAGARPRVDGLAVGHVEVLAADGAVTVRIRSFETSALGLPLKWENKPSLTFPLLEER